MKKDIHKDIHSDDNGWHTEYININTYITGTQHLPIQKTALAVGTP